MEYVKVMGPTEEQNTRMSKDLTESRYKVIKSKKETVRADKPEDCRPI